MSIKNKVVHDICTIWPYNMKMYVPIHDSSSNIDQEYTKKHEVQVDVVEQLHISIESLIEIIKRE